jgi:hypothetical protein
MIAASDASRRTPRRLQRSARIPDGTSSTGTTMAYTAAMTPTVADVKPMLVMNSFSIGTQRASAPKNEEPYRGRSRRLRASPPNPLRAVCSDACVTVTSILVYPSPPFGRRL